MKPWTKVIDGVEYFFKVPCEDSGERTLTPEECEMHDKIANLSLVAGYEKNGKYIEITRCKWEEKDDLRP